MKNINSKKLIYTSYSPNTRNEDLRLNIKLFFKPLVWKTGDAQNKIIDYFKKYYPGSKVYLYNYARSALYHFFKNQEISSGDEVIYQGFTCSAAVLPALWSGLKPRYCDIDPTTLCMDTNKLKELVNENTKYIVLQHTLGSSPEVDEIRKICNEKGIILIEDCTHFLPSDNYNEIGKVGDISIFSFGRDKIISGVDGGVLMINDPDLVPAIENDYLSLDYPDGKWLLQRMFFPIIWWYVKKYYFLKIGKAIHLASMKLGLLTKATSPEEKLGERPGSIPAKLPNALAELAWNQIKDINSLQENRIKIGNLYDQLLDRVNITENMNSDHYGFMTLTKRNYPALRYSLLIKDRDKVLKSCYDLGVNLGDWYSQPIAPVEIDQESFAYTKGSCPNAEKVCKSIINLPTHINISEDDCRLIVETLIEVQKDLIV